MEDGDGRLVNWSSAGDPRAFVELFWRHGSAVHAYLSRRVGHQDGDDLLSEVWLRAFKARETWRGPDVLPWLYGIAHNVVRAHWRRSRMAADVASPTESADPWPDVDDRLGALAQGGRIRECLDRLSESEREVLLLVVWEELTPAQVAVALDIPQGTARSRLHRALSLFRREGLSSSFATGSYTKES